MKKPKPPPDPKRVITPLADDLLAEIDGFKKKYRLPSQSAAIRVLLWEGLSRPESASARFDELQK